MVQCKPNVDIWNYLVHYKFICEDMALYCTLWIDLSTFGFITPSIVSYVDLWFHNVHYCFMYYHQAYNATFHQKLKLIQYNPCLALTWAIRGSSKEKFYEEIGLESLQHRRWYRKLSYFYEFCKNEFSRYLLKLIPLRSSGYSTRSMQIFLSSKENITFLKTLFFHQLFHL